VRKYELVTIIQGGDLTVLEESKKALAEILSRNNVEVIKEEPVTINRRPHDKTGPVNGQHYLHVCKIAPEKVKDISHELELEQAILRYMVRRAA